MINFSSLIEALNDAANIANSSLVESSANIMDTYFEKNKDNSDYSAIMVSINYPVKTDDNSIKNVPVDVPLITLVPVSTSRIEKLKFKANLDMVLKNNELLVSFSNTESSSTSLFGKKEKYGSASIEITLKPNENPEGLKNIIEGYEKTLRAQIPN